jgi:aminomethyltransferase
VTAMSLNTTPLFNDHQTLNAKLVDFAGWHMPIHYGSAIAEHNAVRQRAGMFDVSHMGAVDITGVNAQAFLRYALANDIDKLNIDNKALYTCMLNPQGGIIDDLIVYRLNSEHYRLIVNASGRETDVNWLHQVNAIFDATITTRFDLAIVAVQGPNARELMAPFLGEDILLLKRFHCTVDQDTLVARTGYTGEDGVECVLPPEKAQALWHYCLEQNIQACGLAARDSLRLEGGLNLYGNDMNTTTSPLISNLAWTVCFKDTTRDFVGKQALETEKNKGIQQQLIGVALHDRGVLRHDTPVYAGDQLIGQITSGGFSPSLGYSIGLARVTTDLPNQIEAELRGRRLALTPTTLPFVKAGTHQS